MLSTKLQILMGLSLSLLLGGQVGLACSCMPLAAGELSTIQQTAKWAPPEFVVARVKSVGKTPAGSNILEVQKVYRGSVSATTIRVRADDGNSCYERLLKEGADTGIVMLRPDSGILYSPMSCGLNNLEINPENLKIKVPYVNGVAELSDEEFASFLKGDLKPQAIGLFCVVNGHRFASNNSGDKREVPSELRSKVIYSYQERFEASGLSIDSTVDRLEAGKVVGQVKLKVDTQALGQGKYELTYQVSDMSFATPVGKKITLPEDFSAPSDRGHLLYKNIEGQEVPESFKGIRVVSQVSVSCSLNEGLPLQ